MEAVCSVGVVSVVRPQEGALHINGLSDGGSVISIRVV